MRGTDLIYLDKKKLKCYLPPCHPRGVPHPLVLMSRIIALITFLLPLLALAGPAEISGARLWIAPDQTQLVIDANAPWSTRSSPSRPPTA